MIRGNAMAAIALALRFIAGNYGGELSYSATLSGWWECLQDPRAFLRERWKKAPAPGFEFIGVFLRSQQFIRPRELATWCHFAVRDDIRQTLRVGIHTICTIEFPDQIFRRIYLGRLQLLLRIVSKEGDSDIPLVLVHYVRALIGK